MLRDTAAQDRVIERASFWQRHRMLLIAGVALALGLVVLLLYVLRYAGAGSSVARSRLSIATVERGSFVRDIAADGQVVAAVSPTLYANASALSLSRCTRAMRCPRGSYWPWSTARI